MLEISQKLEEMVLELSPALLVGAGTGSVLAGLFIWLGGLGFRKFLVAIVGAFIGGISGFFITGRNTMLALVSAGVGVVLALVLEKIFITIMAAVLAAVLGFTVMGQICVGQAESLKEVCSEMPLYSWVIISALVIISIVAGFFFRRLISALCCAAFGAILLFAGMILLLSYKGTEPISYISGNPSFYGMVFAAMVAFGSIEQLLLCRFAKGKTKRVEKANKSEQKSKKESSSWRRE
jgi:hypothetical protein